MKRKKASATKKLGRSWELTVFLMKETVRTWQDALVEPKRKALPAHEEIDGVGTLVIKEAPERVPWWVERLGDISKLVKDLRQRSPGAVLFVPVKKRLFALTFGYGRSLLAPERLVHDFGVRVVLNSVDPSRLRSIDLRTLEADPLLSKKQFGEGRPLASFGVDTYRDLLRGVAGSPGTSRCSAAPTRSIVAFSCVSSKTSAPSARGYLIISVSACSSRTSNAGKWSARKRPMRAWKKRFMSKRKPGSAVVASPSRDTAAHA